MVNTFGGLAVAIVVTVFYYFFIGRIERLISEINDAWPILRRYGFNAELGRGIRRDAGTVVPVRQSPATREARRHANSRPPGRGRRAVQPGPADGHGLQPADLLHGATTFAQVEKDLSVRLPRTAAFTPMSAAPKQLIINIKQDGTYVVAGKTYDEESLSALLKATARKNPKNTVIIRADVRGYIRPFDTVMSLCAAAGINGRRSFTLEIRARRLAH